MALETYREKRDFEKTREPRGKARTKKGFSYVIQKHAASHLHYDFRLELDGVLLSWAVPKGPSLDPAVKRLAVQVEDHPVEYGGFEGTIAHGEYGGGTVMVWDTGTWAPEEGTAEEDLASAYRKGRLNFSLHGKKLKGSWHLVRTKRSGSKPSWLLFKGTDSFARSGEKEITETRTKSAATGRTLEQIAKAEDEVWHSNRETTSPTAKESPKTKKATARKRTTMKAGSKNATAQKGSARASIDVPAAAPKSSLPDFVEPQLATLVDEAPSGDKWIHEIKFDGYRIAARVEKGKATLLTRRGHDWTAKMGTTAEAIAALPVEKAMFDGELVVLDAEGVSDFQGLQNSLSEGHDGKTLYCVFDLMHLDGRDLTDLPLLERKALLAEVMKGSTDPRLRLSQHVEGGGEKFFASACELGLEGTIAKRAESPYRSGRSRDWVKIKCLGRQEFVVVGFTEPGGSRSHLGALLLATRSKKGGELEYAGKVGTGFTAKSLAELRAKLDPLERKTPPLPQPPIGAEARGVHWVDPKLVAEIAYTTFTRDGHLRHPTFKGLRNDKPAKDVVRETAKHR